MSEDSSISASFTSVAQSLRDTAKWLVGGVFAAAAGVFAGSSLTSLGSLDPINNFFRLCLAAGGLIVGFLALALIVVKALQVFERADFSMREIVAAQEGTTLAKIKPILLDNYRTRLPQGATTLDDYVRLVAEAVSRVQMAVEQKKLPNADDRTLIADARVDDGIFSATAGLMFVRLRYSALMWWLIPGTALAAVGFGLFAWAANPPKPTGPPNVFSLSCTTETKAICDRLLVK